MTPTAAAARDQHPPLRNDQPWWRTAVVYQAWSRTFADSGGDGIGDLRGLLGRLDHRSDLGVDVVWLSPVSPSPQVDNGYDVGVAVTARRAGCRRARWGTDRLAVAVFRPGLGVRRGHARRARGRRRCSGSVPGCTTICKRCTGRCSTGAAC